jgi:tetratricopeptide (TPR) repeat protein
MIRKISGIIVWSLIVIGMLYVRGYAQENYKALVNEKKYQEALPVIMKRLGAIYDTRIEWKRVPTDIITAKRLEEKINVNEEFRKRQAKGFFIEENAELVDLHLSAARCLYAKEDYQASLNHYYQALRFKKVEYDKDDIVYYEISAVYKKQNQMNGYICALETAYTLNPKKSVYSLELGKAYYQTSDKKKAIFHLSRYMDAESDGKSEPTLFLMLANLCQDTGRYLKAVDYYKKYLALQPEDGHMQFGLGYLAFSHTGDYALARTCLEKALKILPVDDIYRRSKTNEYLAEMAMQELEYQKAVELFLNTVKFQDEIRSRLEKKDQEVAAFDADLKKTRAELLKGNKPESYPEYEAKLEAMGRLEQDRKRILYEYERLGAGKSRWSIAVSLERLERYQEAIRYYQESALFNYNADQARERLQKLQLKINRGY